MNKHEGNIIQFTYQDIFKREIIGILLNVKKTFNPFQRFVGGDFIKEYNSDTLIVYDLRNNLIRVFDMKYIQGKVNVKIKYE